MEKLALISSCHLFISIPCFFGLEDLILLWISFTLLLQLFHTTSFFVYGFAFVILDLES